MITLLDRGNYRVDFIVDWEISEVMPIIQQVIESGDVVYSTIPKGDIIDFISAMGKNCTIVKLSYNGVTKGMSLLSPLYVDVHCPGKGITVLLSWTHPDADASILYKGIKQYCKSIDADFLLIHHRTGEYAYKCKYYKLNRGI
jgi:hypothetical protein